MILISRGFASNPRKCGVGAQIATVASRELAPRLQGCIHAVSRFVHQLHASFTLVRITKPFLTTPHL